MKEEEEKSKKYLDKQTHYYILRDEKSKPEN